MNIITQKLIDTCIYIYPNHGVYKYIMVNYYWWYDSLVKWSKASNQRSLVWAQLWPLYILCYTPWQGTLSTCSMYQSTQLQLGTARYVYRLHLKVSLRWTVVLPRYRPRLKVNLRWTGVLPRYRLRLKVSLRWTGVPSRGSQRLSFAWHYGHHTCHRSYAFLWLKDWATTIPMTQQYNF